MMKCNPTVYANCPDRTYCGSLMNAVFVEGSECDKLNRAEVEAPGDTGMLVSLPCKIGDTLWGFRKAFGKNGKVIRYALEGKVTQMLFSSNMELMVVLKNIGHRKFGVDAFYTREEAERALKEENHDH